MQMHLMRLTKIFKKPLPGIPSSSHACMFLVGAALAAVVLWGFWDYAPTVRFSLSYTIRGVLLGLLLTLLSAVSSLLLRLEPKQRRESASSELVFRRTSQPSNLEVRIERAQWAVARAVGEEVLLRGFVLGWSLRHGGLFAFLLTGALSYVSGIVRAPRAGSKRGRAGAFAYFRTLLLGERSRRGFVASVEGLVLAYYYYATRSLWGVVVARFVLESLRHELFTRAHVLYGQWAQGVAFRRQAKV